MRSLSWRWGVDMDFETFRPFLTGTIGGLLSLWLIKHWAPHMPDGYQAKTADQLMAENRVGITLGNTLFIGTLLVGVFLFNSGRMPSNSWSHLCMVIGVAVLAPIVAVLLPTIGKGRDRAIEALVAFAIAQRIPMLGVGLIGILGAICLTGGLGSLLGGAG